MSPIVSVLIANFNGGAYVSMHSPRLAPIAARYRGFSSTMHRPMGAWPSLAISHAATTRVRIISRNQLGSGAARNAGLSTARGVGLRYSTVTTSCTGRLARLVGEAQRSGAQVARTT
jgi:hypothetical protein